MTIKEQINRLIEGYKNHFYQQTGFNVVIIPQVGLPKISFYELSEMVCDYFKVEVNEMNKGRTQKVLSAREACTMIGSKMGYTNEQISKYLLTNEEKIRYYKREFPDKMTRIGYRNSFYLCLEYVYSNYEKFIDTSLPWAERVESYESLFEDTETAVPLKRKRVLQDVIHSYIKASDGVLFSQIQDYLVQENIRTVTELRQTGALKSNLQNLKNKGLITNNGKGTLWKALK